MSHVLPGGKNSDDPSISFDQGRAIEKTREMAWMMILVFFCCVNVWSVRWKESGNSDIVSVIMSEWLINDFNVAQVNGTERESHNLTLGGG